MGRTLHSLYIRWATGRKLKIGAERHRRQVSYMRLLHIGILITLATSLFADTLRREVNVTKALLAAEAQLETIKPIPLNRSQTRIGCFDGATMQDQYRLKNFRRCGARSSLVK